MQIHYNGRAGAYGHIAAQYFSRLCENVTLKWHTSFAQVFRSLDTWDVACIPIENSYAGPVHENYFHIIVSGVSIYAEYILPIDHCLLSLGDRERIECVYSHPQALSQCEAYIAKHGWRTVACSDTASAVQYVASTGDAWLAAIGSRQAGECAGMQIHAQGIQDQQGNATRFLLCGLDTQMSFSVEPQKVTLIFCVPHTPSSLYHALGVFAHHGVNLLKLESVPARNSPFEYMFWCEYAYVWADVHERLIAGLRDQTMQLQVLGVYGGGGKNF